VTAATFVNLALALNGTQNSNGETFKVALDSDGDARWDWHSLRGTHHFHGFVIDGDARSLSQLETWHSKFLAVSY